MNMFILHAAFPNTKYQKYKLPHWKVRQVDVSQYQMQMCKYKIWNPPSEQVHVKIPNAKYDEPT